MIAAGTSAIVIVLTWLCYLLGFLPGYAALQGAALIVFLIGFFFTLFWTGLNLKFKDPSLTAAQMVSAALTSIYIAYFAGPARSLYVVVLIMIFVFGIFRLTSREFLRLGALIVGAYAVMLILLARQVPAQEMRLDILYFLSLMMVLPWFAMMGGYIGRLRRRLRASIADLELSQELAARDELTGVFNRRYLMAGLHKEQNRNERSATPFSICLMDLDRFKQVNDSLGHAAGDVVLKTLAQTLASEVRSTDYFGRFGGEEFLLVLSQTTLSGACADAERIRREVEQVSYPGLSASFRVTVSIGVTQYRPRESIADTLARADVALYQAKTDGRNRVVCDASPTTGRGRPNRQFSDHM